MLTPFERIRRGLIKLLSVADEGDREVAYVASTCLSKVAYSNGVLTVTFAESGSTYNYHGVSEDTYDTLVNNLGSIGETYNEEIKGVYPYQRIS